MDVHGPHMGCCNPCPICRQPQPGSTQTSRCGAHVELKPVRAVLGAGAGRAQCGHPGSSSRAAAASSSGTNDMRNGRASSNERVDWLGCGQLHAARSHASAAGRGGGGGARAGSWSPTTAAKPHVTSKGFATVTESFFSPKNNNSFHIGRISKGQSARCAGHSPRRETAQLHAH